MAKKSTKYTVTDGELVLVLEPEDGWYCVTSPFNPEIITQARTLEEAFEMARDCAAMMEAAWKQLARQKPKRVPRRSAR